MNNAKYLCVVVFLLLLIIPFTFGCGNPMPPATITYDGMLTIVHPVVNDVASHLYVNQSDEAGMIYFKEKLKALGIESGTVIIDSELGAKGNLSHCIAINTSDRGVVFLYVIPESCELIDEEERLQIAYISKGKNIGLLPAKYAISSDYSWYDSYLKEIYEYYDRCEYLFKISEILDENAECIDSIQNQIDYIDFLLISEVSSYSMTEYDSLNNKIDRLVYLANEYVKEYNDCLVQFNEQIEQPLVESGKYPEDLFYVEEYTISPGKYPELTLSVPQPITIPYLSLNIYDAISDLDEMISDCNSLGTIDNLNRDLYRVERVDEKNFQVINFKICW